MKNFRLLLLCAAFIGSALFSQKANAQVDVTINPIGILFSNLSVGGDFVLSDNFSVEGTIGYGSNDSDGFDYKSIPINAFGKYYFKPDDGADKFYVSAWLRFVNRSYDYSGDTGTSFSDYSRTRVGVGFGVGYKVVANSGLVFDIGFGAGRALIDNTSYDDETLGLFEADWIKLMFAGKLGIGYRFGGK